MFRSYKNKLKVEIIEDLGRYQQSLNIANGAVDFYLANEVKYNRYLMVAKELKKAGFSNNVIGLNFEAAKTTLETLAAAKIFAEQGRKLEAQNALSDLKIRNTGFTSITQMALEIVTSNAVVENYLSDDEIKEVPELLLSEVCTNAMTITQQLRTAELLKKVGLVEK
ncbi:hypothetical protein N8Z18_00585 [bacterium]|nr:hypothetical protein [bacterium]